MHCIYECSQYLDQAKERKKYGLQCSKRKEKILNNHGGSSSHKKDKG